MYSSKWRVTNTDVILGETEVSLAEEYFQGEEAEADETVQPIRAQTALAEGQVQFPAPPWKLMTNALFGSPWVPAYLCTYTNLGTQTYRLNLQKVTLVKNLKKTKKAKHTYTHIYLSFIRENDKFK